MFYTYMERVKFNENYGFKHWCSRELLFGISEILDDLLVNNFMVVGDLFADGGTINNEGFQIISDSSESECFCVFYNQDQDKLIGFLKSSKYKEYNYTITGISEYLNWEYSSIKLLELDKDIDMTNLDFEKCNMFWDSAKVISVE